VARAAAPPGVLRPLSQHLRRAAKQPAPPMQAEWLDTDRWATAFAGQWERAEHNNALEGRGALAVLRHLARSSRSRARRALVFTDSLAVVGALGKGRASSHQLLR
ncbi:unnamed protein product, partial [Prorocentrum cordatum]